MRDKKGLSGSLILISSINYSIPRCSNDASMQRGKCENRMCSKKKTT
nr:hypothetical protein [Klebsiella pneumoniae]